MPSADPIDQVKSAFHNNNAPLLRELLAQHPQLKARVNDPVFSFDSPPILHVRSREMLDVLLEAGADINARSKWWAGGFGILQLGDPALAAYAIERGAVVDAHAAARLGMMDRLRELISADPSLVHARGGDGQFPLHFAGTIEAAAFLLDHGAEIDALDVDHESTAAQWMIRDRPPVVRYLVERGAKTDLLLAAALGDVALVKKHLDADPALIRMSVTERYFPKRDPRAGGTIYIWTLGPNVSAPQVARKFGHEDVLRLLMERSPAPWAFVQWRAIGEKEEADKLLAANPGLLQTLGEEDQRVLPNAAEANDTQLVARLLELGFPANAKGRHGGMALHWACFHGNAAMTEEILRYRPPLEVKDDDHHSTPMGWATHGSEHGWYCKTGDYAGVVKLLCDAGAAIPKKLSGTPAVQEVLRQFQSLRPE